MEGEDIVCSSCGSIIGIADESCPKCKSPTAAAFNLDPLKAIESEGNLLLRATQGRQKPIVVIGIWILFLPLLFVGIFSAVTILGEGMSSGISNFVFFWGAVGLAFIGFTVLFKVTKNYFAPTPTENVENEVN